MQPILPHYFTIKSAPTDFTTNKLKSVTYRIIDVQIGMYSYAQQCCYLFVMNKWV